MYLVRHLIPNLTSVTESPIKANQLCVRVRFSAISGIKVLNGNMRDQEVTPVYYNVWSCIEFKNDMRSINSQEEGI